MQCKLNTQEGKFLTPWTS